jgi:hypothetical protein
MKKKLQWMSILIGCLLAVAIVCVQVFQFHTASVAKKEVKTEQQETNQSPDQSQVSLPSFSLPSPPVHVSVNLDAYCLFEILFKEHKESENSEVSTVLPQKLMVTLFRVIISPNAP